MFDRLIELKRLYKDVLKEKRLKKLMKHKAMNAKLRKLPKYNNNIKKKNQR